MEKLFDWISYRSPNGISGILLGLLLFPFYLLSFLYGIIIKVRLRLYKLGLLKTRKAGVTVISVGNITVGGTGKTPSVELIAKLLTKEGRKVAVVSRGYKGQNREAVNVVSDGESILLGPELAGDEPFMLAQKLRGVPVLIGKERFEVCQYAGDKFDLDAVILDDGFQHLRLRRDFNILITDGKRGVGNGHMFPRGPLREPVSGIKRADLIILNGSGGIDPEWRQEISRLHPSAPLFEGVYRAEQVKTLWKDETREISFIKGAKVALLTAIASPRSFRALIDSLGGDVVTEFNFADHHAYTQEELRRTVEKAGQEGAEFILTTEKDAVKLEQLGRPDGISLCAVKITLDLSGRERELLNMLRK